MNHLKITYQTISRHLERGVMSHNSSAQFQHSTKTFIFMAAILLLGARLTMKRRQRKTRA